MDNLTSRLGITNEELQILWENVRGRGIRGWGAGLLKKGRLKQRPEEFVRVRQVRDAANREQSLRSIYAERIALTKVETTVTMPKFDFSSAA